MKSVSAQLNSTHSITLLDTPVAVLCQTQPPPLNPHPMVCVTDSVCTRSKYSVYTIQALGVCTHSKNPCFFQGVRGHYMYAFFLLPPAPACPHPFPHTLLLHHPQHPPAPLPSPLGYSLKSEYQRVHRSVGAGQYNAWAWRASPLGLDRPARTSRGKNQ